MDTIGAIDPGWKTITPRGLPQAFPYQGSKRVLAREILSLFPHRVDTLWEPFAGSSAISIASLKYGFARRAVISDVNVPLMNLWTCIINSPEELSDEYERHWKAQLEDPRAYYSNIRDEFNKTGEPSLFLYLLCRCVKASIRYNKKTGEFNQSADHRRLGTKPQALRKRIVEVSAIMQEAYPYVGNYEDFLLKASPDDLVYMDPPYQGTTDVPDHRYLKGLSFEEFSKSLEKANDKQLSYIVSYDAQTHDNKYGQSLPDELKLAHLNVKTGISTQGTLNGDRIVSYESIYVSPVLTQKLGGFEGVHERLKDIGQHELIL